MCMNVVTLTEIPFSISGEVLLKHVHLAPDAEDASEVLRMAREAQAIGIPKAMYQVSFAEKTGERSVTIDNIPFNSRVLRVNLDNSHRVFPYMATCGMELQRWSTQFDDMLAQYWADVIKALALAEATSALYRHIQMEYMPGPTGTMNPGSLRDWPISEQKPFFALFGSATDTLGVHLSSSYLMTPNKSVTGLQFATEEQYQNCQLCPREDCPGRRAPYDEMRLEQYDAQP